MITTRLCEVPVHFELCMVCVTIAQLQLYHGTVSSLPLQCLPADGLKGKSLSSDAQSRFVELLLYIPILEFAELKQIAALLRTGSLNSSSARYLLHLVDQRWEHLVHSGCNSVQFTSQEILLNQTFRQSAACLLQWWTIPLPYHWRRQQLTVKNLI